MKPFAILSMIGSICIIKHIIASPKHLVRTSTFHRILLGLSILDLTTSFVVFLGTWPIPKDTPNVYLASGNDRTCTAQGFWVQLGVGVPLYNASLSVYYFLVIFKGWKEHQVKKVEPFLHILPILFALTTSIIVAATDNYASSNVWCWISMNNNGMRFGFFYGPIWAAVLIVTFLMASIYCKFLMQERKTKKYTDSEERIRHRQSELSGLEEGNSNKLRLQSSKLQSIRTSQTLGNDRRVSTLGTNTRLQSTVGQTVGTRNSTISAVRSSHSSKIAAQALWYVGSFYLTFLFPSWTRIVQMLGNQPPFAVVACFTIFFPMQESPRLYCFVLCYRVFNMKTR